MGTYGPAPKPTALKLLNGNAGKHDLPAHEPKPQSGKRTLACLAWLDDLAQKEWHRVVPELHRMGLLATVDQTTFALYCDAYSKYRKAREVIEAKGMTYTKGLMIYTRPEIKVMMALSAQIRGWSREFGFTPSARGQMNIPGLPENGEKDDWVD